MEAKERDKLLIEMYGSVKRIDEKLDNICEQTKDHRERIKTLELKPGKRWESFVSGIIGAIIGAVVAFFTKR